MNKEYWIIISRDDFTNLYKFRDIEVDFSDIIHNDIEKSLENKFKSLPFDDEFGFIIIKFEDKNYNQDSSKYKLDIRNCKSIYTLSEISQKWYSVKFNQNIKFNVIEYLNILENVKNYKYLENINMGIDILFEQFEITNKTDLDKKFDKKFKEKLLEYKSSDKHFYKSTKFENFYFDLLLYERKSDKFGKEDVSYIYDVVVLIILKDREKAKVEEFYAKELKIITEYSFCKILHSENKKDRLINNINLIKERKEEHAFKAFTKKIDIKDLVIGILFLKIKDLLNEEDGGHKDGYQEEIKSLVNDFKNDYKEEVSISLYLIGLLFGYETLYDYNYDFIELDIFKDSENDTIEVVEKKDENKKSKLELEEMKGKSNMKTIQKVKEEPSDVSSEDNTKIVNDVKVENKLVDKHEKNTFTDEEILVFSRSHLEKIAKKRGVEKPTSKRIYPKGDEGKIKLYKAILSTATLL